MHEQPIGQVHADEYVNHRRSSDVEFRVESKSFYALREVLIRSSNTFRELLEASDARTIEITGISARGFESVLHYVYSGRVDIREDVAEELLRASDRFQLEGLKHLCGQFASNFIAMENLCTVYNVSHSVNAQLLKTRCVMFMLEMSEEMVTTRGQEEFLALTSAMMPDIRDYLTRLLNRLP